MDMFDTCAAHSDPRGDSLRDAPHRALWRRPISLLLVALVGVTACERPRTEPTTSPVLSQELTSTNGLLTVHYPADFAGRNTDGGAIVVTRTVPGREDAAISFVTVEDPISDELQELARGIDAAAERQLESYVERSSRAALCVGLPGIETTGTWRSESGAHTFLRTACHFLHNGHGYSIAYSVLSGRAAEDEPTMRAIREASQFNR